MSGGIEENPIRWCVVGSERIVRRPVGLQDTTSRDALMITAIDTVRLTLRNYQDQDAAALLVYIGHTTVHCFARGRLSFLAEAQRDIREKLAMTCNWLFALRVMIV
jgi:hypothetical protein